MGRKPSLESAKRRERVLAARETITNRYCTDLVALGRLAAEYGVSEGWLSQQFHEWGIKVRSTAEARRARSVRAARQRSAAKGGRGGSA